MNKSKLHRAILVASLLATFGPLSIRAAATDACCAMPMADKPASTTAAPTASTASAYPLSTCLVSGEPLESGDMGGPVDYVHKEAGKPDRLVRFCCSSCVKKFKKDPAKYLAKLDAAIAAAGKPEAVTPAKPAESHSSHAH